MPYYRVDKRPFSVGDKITTAKDYYGRFTGAAKAVEDFLEESRPGSKTCRTNCLFVFCDEQCAKKHWSKMSNGKLYHVEIYEDSICHRGDMALMDRMKELVEEGKSIEELAGAYWRSECSSAPEIEIMVESAFVIEVLSVSDAERLAYLKERWGIGR
ncbi:hypothetical protein [Methylomonas methanica]|nr:hypothetical protein [Methylomonas methanica]